MIRYLLICCLLSLSSCEDLSREFRRLGENFTDKQRDTHLDPLIEAIESVIDESSSSSISERPSIDILPLRLVLLQHLEGAQYTQLEAKLDELQEKNVYSKDGRSAYVDVMEILSNSSKLEQWRNASPQSIHPKVLEINKSIVSAWAARGKGYASTVSDEGWVLFSQHLEQANQKLNDALQQDPENPAALKYGMVVARGQDWSEKRTTAYIKKLQSTANPEPLVTPMIILNLTSRWGGSIKEMSQFMENDLKTWPDGAGKFQALLIGLTYEIPQERKQKVLADQRIQTVLEKAINKYAKTWPEGVDLVWRIAEIYQDEGFHQQAIELCDSHLKRQPNSAKLIYVRGRSLWKTNRRKEAIEAYEKATLLDPTSGLFQYQLAWVHTQSSNYTKSETPALKALDLLPSNEVFQRERCLNYIAISAHTKGEWQRTIQFSQEALKLKSNNTSSWYVYGGALYAVGKRAEGKKAWQNLLNLDGSFRDYLDGKYPGWAQE